FFFSSRRRHTRSKRDWSSDVCSSVSVVVTVVAATVAVFVGNDRERTGQSVFVFGVVGTGDLEIVLAEVGRGVRGAGAVDRESDDPILVRDLVQGDALDVLRSGNDLQ